MSFRSEPGHGVQALQCIDVVLERLNRVFVKHWKAVLRNGRPFANTFAPAYDFSAFILVLCPLASLQIAVEFRAVHRRSYSVRQFVPIALKFCAGIGLAEIIEDFQQ